MRQIHQYQIIRYYPHSLSEEFINVGVILNGASGLDKIISTMGANMIYCSVLIGEKKKFMGMVNYLHELSQKGQLRDANHYFNNFRFSDSKELASDKKVQDILDSIFYDYIGHKYPTKKTIDERMHIIQTSFELVEKDFKKDLRIHTSSLFDFELESIKRHTWHHSIIGSSGNRQDISKAIFAPKKSSRSSHIYDFLDVSKQHREQSDNFKEILATNNVLLHEYAKEEDITLYLEKIA